MDRWQGERDNSRVVNTPSRERESVTMTKITIQSDKMMDAQGYFILLGDNIL